MRITTITLQQWDRANTPRKWKLIEDQAQIDEAGRIELIRRVEASKAFYGREDVMLDTQGFLAVQRTGKP